ncbi:MAG: hypothetical protein WD871_01850 [Xanthobacteraceae bacterium]
MFKIVDRLTFTHTVRVMVPADNGHREETLRATYRVLRVDEINAFNVRDPNGARDFLREAIVKLDDLADESGNALAYSDAVRDAVLGLPHARAALASAYLDAVERAKAKN